MGLSYANNEIKWRDLDAVCKIILGCGSVAEEMLKGLYSENKQGSNLSTVKRMGIQVLSEMGCSEFA